MIAHCSGCKKRFNVRWLIDRLCRSCYAITQEHLARVIFGDKEVNGWLQNSPTSKVQPPTV